MTIGEGIRGLQKDMPDQSFVERVTYTKDQALEVSSQIAGLKLALPIRDACRAKGH